MEALSDAVRLAAVKPERADWKLKSQKRCYKKRLTSLN